MKLDSKASSLLIKLGLTLLFLVLTFAYLWPAPLTLWNGWVAGKGYDDSTLLFQYWWVREIASQSFLTLFNPALFSIQTGFPDGQVLWFPWFEKLFIAFLPHSIPLNTLPALHLIALHFLNLTCSYWCARKYEFNRTLSFLFAIGFSLTPYVFFRSQMHHALAGVYAYPLMLIAVKKISTPWKAGILFLAALSSAHYYYFAFILFFPTAFLLLGGVRKENFKKWYLAALLPLVFLGFTKLGYFYDPLQLRNQTTKRPTEVTSWAPEAKDRAWDVLVYSARLPDYFSGNYEAGKTEWNPLKKKLTEWNMKREGGDFYPQERSSSIRWLIFVLAALLWFKRKELSINERELAKLAVGISVMFFIFSLSPRAVAPFGRGVMPSQFFHQLFIEMRAANRFSVGVHLGIGLLAIMSLKHWIHGLKRQRVAICIVILLYFVENLPTFAFPIREVGSSLETRGVPEEVRSHCGYGFPFPFRARDDIRTYRTHNEIRMSNCVLLSMTSTFDFENWVAKQLNDPHLRKSLLQCIRPSYILFEPGYQDQKFENELNALGYTRKGDGFFWKSTYESFSWECYLKKENG